MEVKDLREVRVSMADLLNRRSLLLDLRLDLLRRGRFTALLPTFFNVPRLMSKATIGIPYTGGCPERGSAQEAVCGPEPKVPSSYSQWRDIAFPRRRIDRQRAPYL